jgi:hypothetical protein
MERAQQIAPLRGNTTPLFGDGVGFGNGVSFSVTPAFNIVTPAFNVVIAGLTRNLVLMLFSRVVQRPFQVKAGLCACPFPCGLTWIDIHHEAVFKITPLR